MNRTPFGRIVSPALALWRGPLASRKLLRGVAGAALLGLGALAGCQNSSGDTACDPNAKFMASEGPQDIRQQNFDQAAVGARADATLYRAHFDGTRLSSLGESKLMCMLNATPPSQPAVVYVDLPASDRRTAGRRATVEQFLKDHGRTDRYEVHDGPNPDTLHPAAPIVQQLQRMDTGTAAPAAGSAATVGTPGPGGAGAAGGVNASASPAKATGY